MSAPHHDIQPGAPVPLTAPFLAACRRQPTTHTPVWFMRQAGRALPEYRELRGRGSILESIRSPELAAEITMQPVRRYGVDAAILFSDIVVPVWAVGFGLDIRAGVGPVVDDPFASEADLDRLRPLEPEADIPYVLETVRLLRNELEVPLIGFAGAPFTLASYLIEGGPSRNHLRTKSLMWRDPDLWARLLDRLADMALASLRAQVEAGAQAVQLFDSWVGSLSPGDYRRSVLPASRKVFAGLADLEVPRIHFGVGTGELLGSMAEAGADVVGVDWRVPLDRARDRLGPDVAVQGNLDPAVVLAGWEVTREHAADVLRRGGGRGHIFNLGHGVHPETDPGVLTELVGFCHQFDQPG
ncbi:MAG TPA: uroporphyrinogen decarboxylase [Acidimicrobiales bacterium]|nr:uroporphyrinogen decarboxylase [Acidimicrobiales bacterium]